MIELVRKPRPADAIMPHILTNSTNSSIRSLFLLLRCSAEVMTGTSADVVRVSRQILNRSMANRIIPKQECMVELADLPLVLSSEVTETINLSGSFKVSSDSHADLVSQYRSIAKSHPDLTLYEFCRSAINEKAIKGKYREKMTVIPHFVGASGQPKYPPTPEYAMAVLVVHKPWGDKAPKRRSSKQAWVEEFLEFIALDDCPDFVKLEFARVKERHESKRPPEAVAAEECYDQDASVEADDTIKDLLSIIATQTTTNDPFMKMNDQKINRGLHYDWSQRTTVSHQIVI